MDAIKALVCPKAIYKVAEKNWKNIRDHRSIDLDASMIPLLDTLNAIKGLVSTFSCEGHPEINHGGQRSRQNRVWIRFLVTEEGVPKVFSLYNKIRSHREFRQNNEMQLASRLCMVTEHFGFGLQSDIRVPGFVLSLPAHHPQLKTESWTVLKECLLDQLAEEV